MTIDEVAFEFLLSVGELRAALSHIDDLSYVTIRLEGMRILFITNSSDARALGFLVDADVFEILDKDAREAKRLALLRKWMMRRRYVKV